LYFAWFASEEKAFVKGDKVLIQGQQGTSLKKGKRKDIS
jgi:hypothetical protein